MKDIGMINSRKALLGKKRQILFAGFLKNLF